jgi:hypothetical protein
MKDRHIPILPHRAPTELEVLGNTIHRLPHIN